jgi:hypothetical protein
MAHRGVRDSGGGSLPRLQLMLLCLAALAAGHGVAAFMTPTLGSAYLLQQLTFNSASVSSADGSFASATFKRPEVNTMPSMVRSNVVWDARNNSLAYLLDLDVIRVLDFANPTGATAVTTLAVPGYATIPYTTSICGDTKSPQTLYVVGNWHGSQGKIYAIKLDFTNGAHAACIRRLASKRA